MIVFAKADGTVSDVLPSPVYQGSNLGGSIYFVAPFSRLNAVSVAFTLPNGINTKPYKMTGVSELAGITDKFGKEYSVWEWQDDNAEVTQYAGVVVTQFSVYLPNGQLLTTSRTNFTVQAGVPPELPPAPDPDVYEEILRILHRLQGPFVTEIEKVPGASNAIRYMDNYGVISEPIVIGGGQDVPIPVNTASKVIIPIGAWTQDGQKYTYTLTKGMHGQMRDGATANDLWVSFDESESDEFKGAYEDYTVNSSGDITISVAMPVAMTVRVWNGKGIKGEDGYRGSVQWGVNAPTKISTLPWKEI